MRTLVTSVFVMGLVAGAVAVGTSNAASTLPKAPAPKSPAKKKTPPIFEPLRPLHISEDGTPLRCMHNTECTMRGQLGGGHKVLLALAGGDGKKRFALQQRWSSGEVIFKIPKSVPIGSYGLTIVDIQSKPLSNEIRVNLVRTQEEWLAHCATKANRDADGDGSLNWDCGGNDCNDANPRVAPEFTEVCDDANLDEDCDPSTFGDQDLDGDRHVNARCCNGTRCGADCDDTKRTAHPDSPEVCNTRDDDCDGLVDEGMTMTAFRDNDKDLYGDAKQTVTVCSHMVPKGFVTNDLDCDDTNVAKNPRGGCP